MVCLGIMEDNALLIVKTVYVQMSAQNRRLPAPEKGSQTAWGANLVSYSKSLREIYRRSCDNYLVVAKHIKLDSKERFFSYDQTAENCL